MNTGHTISCHGQALKSLNNRVRSGGFFETLEAQHFQPVWVGCSGQNLRRRPASHVIVLTSQKHLVVQVKPDQLKALGCDLFASVQNLDYLRRIYRIPRKASPNRAMIQATSPHRARLERFTKVRIYCKLTAVKTKRAYKERFYPTPEQEKLLAQSFGCARFVYNNTLRFSHRCLL